MVGVRCGEERRYERDIKGRLVIRREEKIFCGESDGGLEVLGEIVM